MLRPFLLIGVGGSGGKTLRVVRETLRARLREAGWPAGKDIPAGWQFLQIDVASAPDGDDPDLPAQLPPADFLGMVGPGITYSTLDSALALDLDPHQQLASLGGWKPDQNRVQVAIAKGAGQYRGLGRVVALTRLEEVKARVDKMVNAITDAEVKGELDLAAKLLGQSSQSMANPDPVVLIVSSIAGGSGAGALIDICDVVRSGGRPWLDHSIGILYAPDVFDEIPPASRRGVRPNALATISELMAGYWSFEGRAGGVTESTSQLYKSRKIETTAINRLGPRYPLLVGARNADVSYGEQNEIYRGMGIAIAEWMSSDRLQDQMNSYVFGNWVSTASAVPDRLGLKLLEQETPFSAFGFARLSLGRDVFSRYASQYLARRAVETIRLVHLSDRMPSDNRTDDEIISAKADAAYQRFLMNSGLDERGSERNQMQDALRPAHSQEDGRAWKATTLENITRGLAGEPLPAAAWQQRIEQQLRDNGPGLLDKLQTARHENARKWVTQIQRSLAEHVVNSVAVNGGPVTAKLLHRLSQEMEDLSKELPEERQQQLIKVEKAHSESLALIASGGSKIPATSEIIEQAVHKATISLMFKAEADLILLTEQLARDIRSGLLQPLAVALDHGLGRLGEDAKTRNGEVSVVELWPEGDDIPPRIRPARNEFLLDDIEEFPGTMRTLLMRDTKSETPMGAEALAVYSLITDSDNAEGLLADRPRPMFQEREWVPGIPELNEVMSSPSPARFRFAINAESILNRASLWIGNDDREFGRYLASSMKNHLEEPSLSPQEKAKRLERFKAQWRATLERGKPLVNIDSGLLAIVHDKSVVTQRPIISSVPLPENSDSARAAREVLDQVLPENAPDNFLGDAVGQVISVFWVLGEPYEAVVFSSLLKPIADEWADARMDSDSRQIFWMWRRSRSMPEFIPTAPAVRRAMVRGWFTAIALGQLKVPKAVDGGAVEIWIPGATGGEGQWAPFPYPFLKPYGSEADAIGAVFESMIIGLLEVHSRVSLDPIQPYARLRKLGSSGPSEGVAEYETLNEVLQNWVHKGEVGTYAPAPASRMGDKTGTPMERATMLQERLASIRSSYVKRFHDIEVNGKVLAVPRDYEIRHDILAALDDLIARCADADAQEGDYT